MKTCIREIKLRARSIAGATASTAETEADTMGAMKAEKMDTEMDVPTQ
jgi:hypothetical protein